MMQRIALACIGLLLMASPVSAQSGGPSGGASGPGVGGSTVQSGSQLGRGNITADEFDKLQDAANLSGRLNDKKKTLEDLVKEDTAAATALVAGMPLSCQVAKAIMAAEGPETVNGKTVQTKTYETVCANGMGYFLISRESGTPSGISCFAADTLKAADIAAGRKPGPYCSLAELADVKAMATNVITRAGTPCTVRDYRYLGLNAAAHTEFDEIACNNNSGYILAIALPGSAASVRVSTCRDSALRGLPCKLSDNGGVVITVETFKQALAQRGVACTAADNEVHVFGQENAQKRYVVEFKCHERPQGLVSYIPLADNKAPFEALDCAAASRRGVKCILTTAK